MGVPPPALPFLESSLLASSCAGSQIGQGLAEAAKPVVVRTCGPFRKGRAVAARDTGRVTPDAPVDCALRGLFPCRCVRVREYTLPGAIC